MTRTWYSLPGDDPFAVAGLWRATEEWGDAYTMVMVESSPQMREVHDRMPVILPPEAWPAWLGEAKTTHAELQELLRIHGDDGFTADGAGLDFFFAGDAHITHLQVHAQADTGQRMVRIGVYLRR